ncbi:MAG TPA: phosphoadenylyl-sulfate reductase [Bacteroidia bacterium]|nr:phosphoadenylyl-sulfate reductase [Bacteroidia bacterium]
MSERSSVPVGNDSLLAEAGVRFGIDDFASVSRELDAAGAEARIEWAFGHFGESLGMTSSFGAQSAVLLHLATQVYPGIPVVLVDTGYLFPETYRFIDQLSDRLRLNLKTYRSDFSPAWQEARWGKLWEQGIEGIERYNQLNKVEPMDRALVELGLDAVMAGVRRQQSSTRERFSVLGLQKGRVRVHPIVDWTDLDIGRYLTEHGLPYHPLWDEGYVSIGDWHTTRKLTDGMTAEETRFFGLKRECGLNENLDFVI